MRIAIHQPCFLPWTGFFHRLLTVDRFLAFDHVQAPGGRSWITRNRLLVGGEARWITLPIKKAGRHGQAVRDMEILYEGDVVRKHLRTAELSYGKSPHGQTFLAMLHEIYDERHTHITAFNLSFIRRVREQLGRPIDIIYSSDLAAQNPALQTLAGNELVIELCRAAGATEYVSGQGCLDFIDPQAFERQGIAFYFHDFVHRPYPQVGTPEFVSHLSVFDALCNIGADGVRSLISEPNLLRPAASA